MTCSVVEKNNTAVASQTCVIVDEHQPIKGEWTDIFLKLQGLVHLAREAIDQESPTTILPSLFRSFRLQNIVHGVL